LLIICAFISQTAFDRGFKEHGRQWETLSALVPGRTPKSCEIYFYKFYRKNDSYQETSDGVDEKYSYWTEEEKEGTWFR